MRWADAEVHAADIDPEPSTARAATSTGIGSVHEGDLTDALPDELVGRVDVMVVNAPYVPSDEIAMMPPEARDHEPGSHSTAVPTASTSIVASPSRPRRGSAPAGT